jgi:hypothetical protein
VRVVAAIGGTPGSTWEVPGSTARIDSSRV